MCKSNEIAMDPKTEFSDATDSFLRDMWSRMRNMMEVVEHDIMMSTILGQTDSTSEGRNPSIKLMEDLAIPWTKSYVADTNSALVLVAAMFGEGRSLEEGDIQEELLLQIHARQRSLDSWLDLIRDWHDVRAQTKMSMLQPPLKEDMEMQLQLVDSVLTGSLLSLANYLATGYLFLIEVVRDASSIADQKDVGYIAKWKNMARISKLNSGEEEEDVDEIEI